MSGVVRTSRPFGKHSIVLVVVPCLMLGGCLRRTLVTGLPETEARKVAVALYNGHVQPYVLKEPTARGQQEEKWAVNIHGGDRTQIEAWRILQENGLPRHIDAGIEEVYANSELIPTASEERAKFMLAIGGELSRSLKVIPGVVDARVHVVVPDRTMLRDPDDKPHPTASVLVTYWSNARPPTVEEVKKLVGRGVEGLDEKSDGKSIEVLLREIQPPNRSVGDDLWNSVPTIGFGVDYFCWFGSILAITLAAWILLSKSLELIRWIRNQLVQIWESVVGIR